jgi:phage nucleotide-binding protein
MLDIKSTKSVVDQGLFVLVHGRLGSGKTSLVKTIPDVESNTLVISAESGTLPLRGLDIDMVEIAKYSDVDKVMEFLAEDTAYKWVVVDSLTEIGDKCLDAEARRGGMINKPGWDEYWWYNAKLTDLVRRLRDMRGLHVVLTCLSGWDVEDGRGKLVPEIPAKQLKAKLGQFFDEVLFLNVTNDGQREFITDCNPHVEAKDRSGALGNPEKADLRVIVQKIYGDREPERKVTPDAEKLALLERITKGEKKIAEVSGKEAIKVREAIWKHEHTVEEATKGDLKEYCEALLEEYKTISEMPKEESTDGENT